MRADITTKTNERDSWLAIASFQAIYSLFSRVPIYFKNSGR